MTTDTATTAGVTLVISRRVHAGHEAAYEAWIGEVQASTRGFPGYLGVEVIRPAKAGGEYTSVVRFDSVASLRQWEQSASRRDWLSHLPEDAVDGEATSRLQEGVEFWFTAPSGAAAVQPSRERMATVLVFVVFTLTMILGPSVRFLAPDGVPIVATIFIAIVLQVLLMTYVVMPRVTRILASWLFPAPAT